MNIKNNETANSRQGTGDSGQKKASKQETLNCLLSAACCLLLIFCCLLVSSCAWGKAEGRGEVIAEKYRVALLNAGAYRALGDQAAMDLGSFHEIDLVTGTELDSVLASCGSTQRDLVDARSFDELAKIESLDFVLVLLPAPPAYPVGSVGLRSINWRAKSVKVIPAIKVPDRPADWLLETRNGWAMLLSEPTGATVSIDDKVLGKTPLLVMVDDIRFAVVFQWTPKVMRIIEVNLDERNRINVRAPGDYYSKHHKRGLYARLQAADEAHGDVIFITFYVIVMLGGLALLFYNPFRQ